MSEAESALGAQDPVGQSRRSEPPLRDERRPGLHDVTSRGGGHGERERGRLGRYAVGVVFLTLLTILFVPLLVNRRVVALREHIEAIEPARTKVNQLQYTLVRQMGSLSELLLSGDTAAAKAFREAQEQERELYAELAPLAAELGPEVVSRFGEVRGKAERWHALAAGEEAFEESGLGLPVAPIARERPVFEDLLLATQRLDRAILETTTATRDRIERAEHTGLLLTVGLALLALIATGAVVALAVRAQRLADESRRRRETAEAALAETARAHRARERLLRGITHDLKNPLGAARGYAELLEMGIAAPLQPEQSRLVQGVHRSIDSALGIIADLLDVARADNGGLSVQPVETDLAEVVALTVEDQRPTAESAGHVLELNVPTSPVLLFTDPARVRQILQNLLSNAVKYSTSPGRIQVRLEVVQREAPWVAVHVVDSGPGVPPHLRERIFDEFFRADDRGPSEGHGLGLAIARRIARLLGGDLVLADGTGPGADFLLWLPRYDRRAPTQDAAADLDALTPSEADPG